MNVRRDTDRAAGPRRGADLDVDYGELVDTVIELDIGAVAHGGHCVARAEDGRVVLVRHALPGERVRARVTEERGQFLRADAIEVLAASPDRVPAPCPYAGPERLDGSGGCGGCDFQHATPAAQRELKAAVIVEQLLRLGGLTQAQVAALGVTVTALPDVPEQAEGLGWRTRVQFTVDSTGQAGLLKYRSHEVVPVDWCRIAHPAATGAGVTARPWPDADRVEVAVSGTGEVSVQSRRGRSRPRLVSGPTRLRERALDRRWSVPPDVFWQVHPAAAGVLAQAVVRLLQPREGERAWDLYGGVGLFAAALAPALGGTGRITVVESDPAAVTAARANLASVPTVSIVDSSVERALRRPQWRVVDLVVLDPPRSGAGRGVIESALTRSPRAVAYVSCDPASFARDVREFARLGWRLSTLESYDCFPMTHHVELVGLFTPGAA